MDQSRSNFNMPQPLFPITKIDVIFLVFHGMIISFLIYLLTKYFEHFDYNVSICFGITFIYLTLAVIILKYGKNFCDHTHGFILFTLYLFDILFLTCCYIQLFYLRKR